MTPQDLKQIRQLLDRKLKSIATKDDVQSILRSELKGYATREEFKNLATRNDFVRLEDRFEKKLEKVKIELLLKIDSVEAGTYETFDKNKADKEDLRNLKEKVEKLEEEFQTS